MPTPEPVPDPTRGRGAVRRALRFGIVGGIGVLVNQGLLMALHGGLGWPLWIASPLAVEASILGNFTLNRLWTWREPLRSPASVWWRHCARYHAATAASAFLGNVGILLALVHWLSVDYRIANLIGIGAAACINFAAGELWIFRAPGPRG